MKEFMKLSVTDKEIIKCLVKVCQKYSGETCYDLSGFGSYSNEFLDATSEICRIFIKSGARDPRQRLLELFRENGVHSCRLPYFTFRSITYLYKKHIIVSMTDGLQS